MTTEALVMGPSPRRPRRRWWGLAAAMASMSLLATVGVVAISAAVTPTIAAAATSCTSSSGASISYHVVATPAPSRPTSLSMVSGVVVSGLSAGCDGETARLFLDGNTTGDPSAAGALLSTATSKLNPCSQAAVTPAPTVKTGSITLDLCATKSTKGSYVSVHDLTHLTLFVGGVQITVTPVTKATTGTGTGAGSGSGSGSSGGSGGTKFVPVSTATVSQAGLAFTGADIAAMTGAGLLIILAGLALLLWSRRRSQPGATAGGGDLP
ncbi:MAG: hypothetical protein ACRDZQ_13785 [Acidimicrobiales bacterium]